MTVTLCAPGLFLLPGAFPVLNILHTLLRDTVNEEVKGTVMRQVSIFNMADSCGYSTQAP